MSIEQKKRKVTQRARLDKNEADKKAPQQVKDLATYVLNPDLHWE